MIKLVKQEEARGCGIACVAMVLGKSYKTVRNDFENDFEKKGLGFDKFIDYLLDHGLQAIKKEVRGWSHRDFARKEMLKPFAPIHIINVQPQYDSKDRHAVVMDAKGKLYCPSGATEKEIRETYIIHEVAGFWK